MKKIIHFFTPSFLKKLDQNLLEKYPFLWSKRFAHVSFFGLLILSINTLVSSFYPISIFSYTPLWVFLWVFTVPAVLFILIWLFFQYKYDLTWDYARIKWTYYFGTGLSYISVVVICLLMVLLPAGIYQYRVNTFYNNSLSVDQNDTDNYENNLARHYLTFYSHEENLSRLEAGTEEYLIGKEQYVDAFIDNLDNIKPSHPLDTIIKPGIETLYIPDPLLILSQPGDSAKRYQSEHFWIVRVNKDTIGDKSRSGYQEGTLNMFSPNLFFTRNQRLAYEKFDSSSYSFQSFFDEYLQSQYFPETKDDLEFNWNVVLSDSSYYIESQKVKFYKKMLPDKIADHRLKKTYSTYTFITELTDQGKQFEEDFVGVNIRGQNLLIPPLDFYTLKRLEYFLFTRFNIKSLEHVTPAIVDEHAAELQELGDLIDDMERDYGKEFINYNKESVYILLIIIYLVSSVLALILLTIRLLNFRLLVISLLGLSIFSFILFVPLIGFRVNVYGVVPIVCLSILYGYFIFSIIRILYAKGTTLFMRVSALSGLIVLPLIALFYFSFYVFINKFGYYSERKDILYLVGLILIVLFLIFHIPLMARTIHRLFYLPKR